MQECNVAAGKIETASSQVALSAASGQGAAKQYAAYIGLDVHKETIAVAVAEPGRGEPIYRGEIANTPKKVERLIAKLSEAYDGGLLLFCYEAGPCGYGLYRQLIASGHDCQVVAPSQIPKKAGERIKTDRRDALKLARLLHSGDLTGVWVPDQEREEGKRRGIQLGEANMLLFQLEQKFGSIPDPVRHRIQIADSDTLLRWSGRVLTEDSIDEVLR